MSDFLKDVGARLREARNDKKLTQAEVSKHLGFGTTEAYGNYERGDRKISVNHLAKFGQLTGVRPEWVMTGDGPKHPDKKMDKLDAALDAVIGALTAERKELLLNMAETLQKQQQSTDKNDS